jgi:hypothetical protein
MDSCPPAWLERLQRRLEHLTPGRYFAIIEVKKRGVIYTLSLWNPAKVEVLDKEGDPSPDDAP